MSQTALISAKTARVRLGVGETTLWRWRRDGIGPRWCKMGRRTMYDLDSVEAFIREQLDACSDTRPSSSEVAA